MQGFKIAGKAFCVGEDLSRLADKFKGWTLDKFLRYCRLIEAERKQFGGKKQ